MLCQIAAIQNGVRERDSQGREGGSSEETLEFVLRRRENMVGVNMVLAEYHQIQTWLL